MTTNTISCNGINHRDSAKEVQCKHCGRTVARTEKGKQFDIRNYHTEGGYERHVYSCYRPGHVCDPAQVELFKNESAAAIASGAMVKGQSVIVARGRKFPKGTEGTITWVGVGEFGERARVQPTEGEAFFIATKNLDVLS